jgi:hypothetical protein
MYMSINTAHYAKRYDLIVREMKSITKKGVALDKKHAILAKQIAFLKGSDSIVSLSEYRLILSEYADVIFQKRNCLLQYDAYLKERKILEDILLVKQCEVIEFKRKIVEG